MRWRFQLALGASAIVALGGTCGAAAAQSKKPAPPAQSTQLTVDLSDRPDAPKPKEEPPATGGPTPEEAAVPVDHRAPGHLCSSGDSFVDTAVWTAGLRCGVDPCFVMAVMGAESGYRRYAVSPKGACGYMQLMPATARRFGVTDIFDAQQNIFAGTRYLRFLLDRFGGNMELALAGYNAGEGAVERFGNRIPPFAETQNYVRIIATRYLSRHVGSSSLRTAASATPPPAPKPTATPAAWRISIVFDEAEE